MSSFSATPSNLLAKFTVLPIAVLNNDRTAKDELYLSIKKQNADFRQDLASMLPLNFLKSVLENTIWV